MVPRLPLISAVARTAGLSFSIRSCGNSWSGIFTSCNSRGRLSIPYAAGIHVIAVRSGGIGQHDGRHVKIVPLPICVLNPLIGCIISVFTHIFPACAVLEPAWYVAGFLTLCIYIISIGGNGVGQHDSFFIHIIRFFIYLYPTVCYKGTICCAIFPDITLLNPSGCNGPFEGTCI